MKIKKDDIEKLVQILNESNISDIEYSEDQYKIKISKNSNESLSVEKETFENIVIADEENIKEIKCPLVGHFYLTKTPIDPPYVKVGDKIQKGDVIGILEAMKVSNEIKSDYSGEIVDILIESGQFVDYDCLLMKIREI